MVDLLEKTEIIPEIYFDTFEEWLAWSLRQEEQTELEDGKVIFVHRNYRGEYMPVKLVYQALTQYLYEILRAWLRRNALSGAIFTSSVTMRTPQRRRYGREPDLLYVAPENLERLQETFVDGPADLCVEIVSPESEERDRDVKFLEYQEAGVREYWIIDPDSRSTQFWRIDETGFYRRVPLDAEGVYTSEVISGLALRPAWLWEDPLPAPPVWEALWDARA
jgi:Uma2 family endonuclease